MGNIVGRGELGQIELIEQHRRVDRIIERIRIDHRSVGVFKVAHQQLIADPGQGIVEAAEQVICLRTFSSEGLVGLIGLGFFFFFFFFFDRLRSRLIDEGLGSVFDRPGNFGNFEGFGCLNSVGIILIERMGRLELIVAERIDEVFVDRIEYCFLIERLWQSRFRIIGRLRLCTVFGDAWCLGCWALLVEQLADALFEQVLSTLRNRFKGIERLITDRFGRGFRFRFRFRLGFRCRPRILSRFSGGGRRGLGDGSVIRDQPERPGVRVGLFFKAGARGINLVEQRVDRVAQIKLLRLRLGVFLVQYTAMIGNLAPKLKRYRPYSHQYIFHTPSAPPTYPSTMPTEHPIQHHVWFSDLDALDPGASFQLVGPEAHHAARVKRIRTHEQIGILDGQGRIGIGVVREIAGSKSKPSMTIELCAINTFEPTSPAVEIWSALPKGDRLDRMIDQLAQLGVSTFRPLICDRSQRKPETIRQDKLERIAIEAAKQCHRPWNLQFGDPIGFAEAIKDPDAVLADASGDTPARLGGSGARIVVLIGPEGGWSDAERAQIVATGVRMIRFGIFVLRIEAAACAASSVVLCQAHAVHGHASGRKTT